MEKGKGKEGGREERIKVMDAWMDNEWTDGWTDGWITGRQMDGRMDIDGWMMAGCVDDGWMMDGRMK